MYNIKDKLLNIVSFVFLNYLVVYFFMYMILFMLLVFVKYNLCICCYILVVKNIEIYRISLIV